jgi:hypothetical protein
VSVVSDLTQVGGNLATSPMLGNLVATWQATSPRLAFVIGSEHIRQVRLRNALKSHEAEMV